MQCCEYRSYTLKHFLLIKPCLHWQSFSVIQGERHTTVTIVLAFATLGSVT
jgi:hypothetical protein